MSVFMLSWPSIFSAVWSAAYSVHREQSNPNINLILYNIQTVTAHFNHQTQVLDVPQCSAATQELTAPVVWICSLNILKWHTSLDKTLCTPLNSTQSTWNEVLLLSIGVHGYPTHSWRRCSKDHINVLVGSFEHLETTGLWAKLKICVPFRKIKQIICLLLP